MKEETKEEITGKIGSLDSKGLIAVFEELGIEDEARLYTYGIIIPQKFVEDIDHFQQQLLSVSKSGRSFDITVDGGNIYINTITLKNSSNSSAAASMLFSETNPYNHSSSSSSGTPSFASSKELDEHDAAIKIQSAFRGFFNRKKYSIKQLPKPHLEDYEVLIEGNDPRIRDLPRHEADEKIALIGTSGMRSVEIALQLSRGTPKIIIIDNSMQVVEFWRKARDLISKSNSIHQFLAPLVKYIDESQCNRESLKFEELRYLEYLFSQHGFENVKKVMSSAAILAQSWADKDIMIKVKAILAVNGIENIYAYPSNIVAYLIERGEQENARRVLDNIQILNPVRAIHTDMVGGMPRNVYLVDDHDPEKVENELQLSDTSSQMAGLPLPVEISPDLLLMRLEAVTRLLLEVAHARETHRDKKPPSP